MNVVYDQQLFTGVIVQLVLGLEHDDVGGRHRCRQRSQRRVRPPSCPPPPASSDAPDASVVELTGTGTRSDAGRVAAVDVVVVGRRVDDDDQGREWAGDRLCRLWRQVKWEALRTVYL